MEPDSLFISALSPEMVQIIVQAREIGIPDTVHLVVPDLTSTEIEASGRCCRGRCDNFWWVV